MPSLCFDSLYLAKMQIILCYVVNESDLLIFGGVKKTDQETRKFHCISANCLLPPKSLLQHRQRLPNDILVLLQ